MDPRRNPHHIGGRNEKDWIEPRKVASFVTLIDAIARQQQGLDSAARVIGISRRLLDDARHRNKLSTASARKILIAYERLEQPA